jgi:tetratricopeptide (TPR) repeat protein
LSPADSTPRAAAFVQLLRQGSRRGLPFIALTLIALGWLPGARAPYQYDDYVTPVKDPASQSLRGFVASVPGTLRPLTKLTYAVESSLGFGDAPERRYLNALLFLATTLLVVALARARGLGVAAAVALGTLWACHPVHAELLLALAGRSVLLSLGLVLLSTLLLLRGRAWPAVCCALAAVLARETAWPWLVVCVGFAARERGRRYFWGAVVLATLLGGALALSARMQQLLAFSYRDAGALNRLGLQWAALPRGIGLWLFDPSGFAVDIDAMVGGWARLAYVLAAAAMYGVAAYLALGSACSRSTRALAWLWLCLVIPLHSVVPKLDALTARDVSASSALLLLLAAAPLARALVTTRGARVAFWGAAAMVLCWWVPLTRARARLYIDPVALWSDAAARSTHTTRPYINLGTLLAQRGRLSEAKRALLEARRRAPNDREAAERLAAVDVLIGTKSLLTPRRPRDTIGP